MYNKKKDVNVYLFITHLRSVVTLKLANYQYILLCSTS